MTEKMDSKWLPLATASILGQAPRQSIAAEDYRAFKAFLQDACGIVLGDSKEYLVASRLNRVMNEYEIATLGDLLAMAESGRHAQLKTRIIDAMTTNETFWFRDNAHFTLLADKILPEVAGKSVRPIRIWSAACSCGQEPYTIAMLIQDLQMRNPGVLRSTPEIIATDVSSRALAEARQGVYCGMAAVRGLEQSWRRRFFVPRGDCLEIRADIKRRISFRQLNLTKGYEFLGRFDIIFCRNVLIYFSSALKRDILKRMASVLNPGGYLFLGSTESLSGHSDTFEMVSDKGGIAYRLK